MSRAGANYLGVALLVAVFLNGASAADSQYFEVLKLLNKPWLFSNRWETHEPEASRRTFYEMHNYAEPQTPYDARLPLVPKIEDEYDAPITNDNDILRMASQKRSAVATALNAGRRRRQPAPALGKVVTPYLGVGVLNDMGMFFDSLRDNLEVLTSLSPQQRATLLHEVPSVVNPPSTGSGGGAGMRRIHALRPLRPTGNIRSYNRRSFVEADGLYPAANHHDPGLLWTGLGRR